MKKITKITMMLATLLLFSYNVQAKTYEESVAKAETYLINHYDYKNTYQRYIYELPTNNATLLSKFYDDYELSYNNFKHGGLLSEKEFKITTLNKENTHSYLYNTKEFWTLTDGETTNTKKVISKDTTDTNINDTKPGLKITEYIQSNTNVTGTGEFEDPWIFSPVYNVILNVNKEKDENGNEVTYGELKEINNESAPGNIKIEKSITTGARGSVYVFPKPGYQYLGNTCGYIINDANVRNKNANNKNELIIHEVKRDFECTINFGEKPDKVNIKDSNETTKLTLYAIQKKSWYSDEQAQNQITKISTNALKKNGYTLKGVYDQKQGANDIKTGTCPGTQYIDSTGNLKDINDVELVKGNEKDLYPCYKVHNYKVKYDCNGGINPPTSTTHVYQEQPIVLTNALAENKCHKDGYKFTGWSTVNNIGQIDYGIKNGNDYSLEPIKIYKDYIKENVEDGEEITLYAQYTEVPKYTVKIYKNGAQSLTDKNGNTLEEVSCWEYEKDKGCKVTLPTITAASGFSVLGYNTISNGTSAIVESGKEITITKNMTYYAITKSTNPVTITFDKNGSNNVTSSLSCYRYNGSASCEIKSPKPTPKSDYTIIGFNTSASAKTSSWDVETSKQISTNTTYYVIQSKKITATFDKNGSKEVSNASLSCTMYNTDTSCSITTPNITPADGFSVLGWNTTKTATSKSVSADTSTNISANTTYYAITKKDITATFDKNGASSVAASSKVCTVYNGSTAGCSITTPTITAASGFSVIGWNTSKNGTTSTIGVNQAKTIKSNETYYAITKKTITITFNVNGASSIGSTSQSCDVYNGSAAGCSITSPSISPASGFSVVGWNTSSSGTTGPLGANVSQTFSSNATYYAITSKQITATFDKSGASSIGATTQSCYAYNGSTAGCTVTTPTITAASGFTVVGWNTSASATSSQVDASKSTTIKTNTTYYAITKKTITVTFEKNGASSIGATSQSCVIYNYSGAATSCNITSPTITAASGFSVIGWNTSTSAVKGWAAGEQKEFTENATYYAITKKTITATFVTNGAGTISSTSQSCTVYNGSTAGCTVITPTITAASGFSVLGWNTATNATTAATTQTASVSTNTSTTIKENTTFYAITKSTSSFTITFNKNGTSSIGTTTLTCYKFNGSSSCNVTAPSITAASGFSVVGWNTSASATSSAWNVGTSKSITANTTYYAITKSSSAITVTFNQNGSSTGTQSKTCYRYNGASSCSITSPSITAKSGFTVLGWGTSSSSTSSAWSVNTAKSFSSNSSYYAITRSSSTISVTFNQNGSSTSTQSKTCYRYNGSSSCTIATPAVTAKSGYTANGWGTSSSSTSKSYNASTNYAFSSSTNLYAIQYKTITVYFYTNTAYSVSPSSRSCTMYNSATTCSVQTGSITAGSGKSALGWSTSSSATSASYSANTSYNFSGTTYLYAITKSTNQTYTINFRKTSSHGFYSFSNTSKTCTGSGSCSVESPTFSTRYNKNGYEALHPCWAIGEGYGCYYYPKDYVSSSESTTWYTSVDIDSWYQSVSSNGVNARSCASTSCGIVDGLNNGHTFIATSYHYASGSGCDNSIWYYGYSENEGWWGYVCSYYVQ